MTPPDNLIKVDFARWKSQQVKPKTSHTLTLIFLYGFVVFFWVQVLESIF